MEYTIDLQKIRAQKVELNLFIDKFNNTYLTETVEDDFMGKKVNGYIFNSESNIYEEYISKPKPRSIELDTGLDSLSSTLEIIGYKLVPIFGASDNQPKPTMKGSVVPAPKPAPTMKGSVTLVRKSPVPEIESVLTRIADRTMQQNQNRDNNIYKKRGFGGSSFGGNSFNM